VEILVVLATLLSEWAVELSEAESLPLTPSLTLQPTDGLRMGFHSR